VAYWTTEATERLVHMYLREYESTKVISARLGMSQAAVRCKIARMQLERDTNIQQLSTRVRHCPKKVNPLLDDAISNQPDDAVGKYTLFDLPERTCRWPFGARETGFTFCGDAAQSGVYCPEHTEKARGAPCRRPR